MKGSIIFLILQLIQTISYVVIKSQEENTPQKFLDAIGKEGAVATSRNLNILTSLLQEKSVSKAYVYGWEDNKIFMVLYSNGTLVEYDESDTSTNHAIFVDDGESKPNDSTEEHHCCERFKSVCTMC